MTQVFEGILATECDLDLSDYIISKEVDNEANDDNNDDIFVSADIGSDANDGLSVMTPLKTLNAATALARSLPTAHPTIRLLPSTFYEQIVLGEDDSNLTITSEDPTKPAVISGGAIVDCVWSDVIVNDNVNAASCTLADSISPPSYVSLFVNNERQKLARYPNGDPLEPCCEGTSGYTKAGPASAGIGECPNTFPRLSDTDSVEVYNADGLLISSGIVPAKGNAGGDVIVNDTVFVHDAGGFVDFQAYNVPQYNSTFNSPYWSSGSANCNNFDVGDDVRGRASNWGKVGEGIVRMFHSNNWGGWAFEIDGEEGYERRAKFERLEGRGWEGERLEGRASYWRGRRAIGGDISSA